jgi:N-methylhydantoinase A
VHACALADQIRSPRVVIPYGAGVSSAFGLLVSSPSVDRVRAYLARLDELDWGEVQKIFTEMEDEGRTLLERMGIEPEEISVVREAEMRYLGQRHQISVTLPPGAIETRSLVAIEEAFRHEYERLYQRANADYPLEALNWKSSLSGPPPPVRLQPQGALNSDSGKALKGKRPIYTPEAGDHLECPVYDRYRLGPGATFSGPAIVEERECATVVQSEWDASVDPHLNLMLTRRSE